MKAVEDGDIETTEAYTGLNDGDMMRITFTGHSNENSIILLVLVNIQL